MGVLNLAVVAVMVLAACGKEREQTPPKCPDGALEQGIEGKEIWCQLKTGESFVNHGPCTHWSAKGRVQVSGSFDRGRRNGRWKTYYPTGKVWWEFGYDHDKKDGEWVMYNPDGTRRTSCRFRRGERVQDPNSRFFCESLNAGDPEPVLYVRRDETSVEDWRCPPPSE